MVDVDYEPLPAIADFTKAVHSDVVVHEETTDLTITGKAAQFGRGVLADVAGKLIGQFADKLEADPLADTAPAATEQVAPAPADASVNMLALVALPLVKRIAPVAVALTVGLAIGWLLGRRSGGAA